MGEADAALASAAHAGLTAATELLDALFKYIVPLILVAVGFFLSGQIGLSGLIANLLTGALGTKISDTAVIWIADLVAVAVWFAIAAMLWHMGSGHADGKYPIVMWVGHSLGGLFAGFGLGEVGAVVSGKVLYGQVSDVATKISAGG
jgi:hypothetical protein